ncbi:MAG: porin [Bdellovibrionota bacterium]|nr:MAG: porin [Bdellovibrionota bacterium]
MRKLSALVAVMLLAPGLAHAKTLEELLVEKGVITKGEAMGASSAGASKVYYDKGTRLEFPDTGVSAKINTQIQSRYTFTDNDDDAGEGNTSSFEVQRARLIVSGNALHNEFSYYLQADFANDEGSDLRDAYIQWHACDWATVRMGQFKTMLGRQFNTSSWKLQFPDRSTSTNYFDLGRQQGAAGHAELADGALLMSAGIFNGLSEGEGINAAGVDTKHTGIVTARTNLMGEIDSFSEGDVEYTDDMGISLGAAYAYSDTEQDITYDHIAVDLNAKAQGFSFHGELFYSTQDPDGGEKAEPLGFYAQAGYFLMPKKFEVAARYDLLDCDDGKATGGSCDGNEQVDSVDVSLNYYWWKHQLKAQLAYAILNEEPVGGGDDIKTNRWMLQLGGYF